MGREEFLRRIVKNPMAPIHQREEAARALADSGDFEPVYRRAMDPFELPSVRDACMKSLCDVDREPEEEKRETITWRRRF